MTGTDSRGAHGKMAGAREAGEQGGVASGGVGTHQPANPTLPTSSTPSPTTVDPVKALSIEKFMEEDYEHWSFHMSLMYTQYKLLDLVEGKEKMPEAAELKGAWMKRSFDAYMLKVQAVGRRQLDHIKDLLGDPECGPKAWRKLLDVHSPTHATGIVLLARRLRDIKFVDGEPMQPVLDEMRDIFTKLQGSGVVYLELVDCVEIVIRLPESWSALAINLNSQQPQWSVDYIRARILEEDLRRQSVERSEEGAGYGVGGGKSGFKKKWKGKNKDYPKEDGGGGQGEVCFYYTKRGHRWRKCYQRPKDWTPPSSSNLHGGKRSGAVMGASAEEKDEEKGGKFEERKAWFFFFVNEGATDLAMAAKVLLHPLTHWVIDSGSSWHMTPRADLLDEIQPAPISTVTSTTGAKAKVMGMGCAKFMGADGELVGLKNVLWVPDFSEGHCYLCVPPDPGIEAAALGASESAAPGAGEAALSGTASAQVLHTFTLDSGASRSFRDCTTLLPLSRLVAVSLADPSRGPFLSLLPCLAVPSGSLSGPESAPCSCRLLTHQTLLWHHRLGHPSLPRLRGMASRVLVTGLPRSLPPLPPGPAPTCVPCVEGRQRAAPHSSEFPPTEAPLQTLHMDMWGPARFRGQGHERYFLLVVDDYSRYTTIFPLRRKGEVTEVLNDWIRAARRQLSESFGSDLPVLRLHSDRGGEFSSDLLRAFCHAKGIRQTFTLPVSPQQNGIAERRIGMVMDVARTSMIHAAAPHFLWPFAVQYVAHQINLQFRVFVPETTPTLRWTGKVGDASVFRVWGSRAFVHDMSADKLSSRAIPCVFLGFPPDAPGWRFYHPTSRRVLSSQDVTFDESGPAPSGVSQVDAVKPVEVAVDSGAARGAEPAGGGSGGAYPERAELGGAESGGAEPGVAESGGAEPEGAEPARVESGGAAPGGPSGPAAAGAAGGSGATGPGGDRTRGTRAARPSGAAGAGGAGAGGTTGPGATRGVGPGAAGAAGASGGPARAGAPGGAGAGGAGAGGAGVGATGAAGGAGGAGGATGVGADARGAGAVPNCSGGAARPRPYFVPLLEQVLGLPPSTGPTPSLECPRPVQSESQLQPASPLPAPSPYTGPTRGLTEHREPESRPASPVRAARTGRRGSRQRPPPVCGTHQMALRPSTTPQRVPLPSPPESSRPALADPEFDSLRAASPTITHLLATVVTDPSFESTAASALVAELVDFAAHCRLDYAASLVAESPSVCPPSVGDPDAPDIPTPRSYAEAIEGPYSFQWQTAMDAEMDSWKSTSTYVDEVPPPEANIVDGMWIFRVKRPSGSPPVFKARYVARGFSQREGVDYFQTFSPTPKMTTLWVLLHVAAQRDYELHSLDFSTAFLQGSLHEEIWLRRPPGFTGSFPPGTQWSLRRQVYSLRQVPSEWHETLRTMLAALGSSCEAEIYAGAMAAQELRWLTYLLTDLGEAPRSPPVLYVDNKAMLALCQEHRLEQRTKHIALRYFLDRELQQRGQLCLAYVATRPTLLISLPRHFSLVIVSVLVLC
ncbi:unnamed protein product [Closterium sp. NIES-54]